MHIALLTDPITVDDYRVLFPNTSFASQGPNDEFLLQNNARNVSYTKTCDYSVERLQGCDPYLEGDIVYMVTVVPLTEEQKLQVRNANLVNVRAQRNRLLAESDWTQMADAKVSNKAEWAAYRDILRNLPDTIVDPLTDSVVYPEQPPVVKLT